MSDPCTLATQADIQSALGASVTGKSSVAGSGSSYGYCEWTLAGGVSVHVSHYGVMTQQQFENDVKYVDCALSGNTCTPISGLGQEAEFEEEGAVTSVYVRTASDTFRIQYFGDSTPSQAALVSLARAIIGHAQS